MTGTKDEFLTLIEAAHYIHVGRQAIYEAIRKNNIHAVKKDRRWVVTRQELDRYVENKYNSANRKFNGQKIFDLERGYYSVLQVSKIISEIIKIPYHTSRIYYLLRHGMLPGYKMGSQWVIKREDAIWLCKLETGEGDNQMRFA